jgi:glycosyltransferase involved in cell wall biosynthesis
VAQVPFFSGGAEAHVGGLREALIKAGHKAEIVALPFKWYPKPQVIRSALAWRFINIDAINGERIDVAICTKFPSYVLKHPCKVTWLIHQFRQAYDWFDTPFSEFKDCAEDHEMQQQIRELDNRTLAESKRLFSNSRNTANRLAKYNGLTATPLYPPLQREGFRPGPYGDYILSAGRLDKAKRLDLLLESLKLADSRVKCVIAGDGPDRGRLEAMAVELGLAGRVRFAGFVPDEELLDLYANCCAVYFAPVDEDYGYITIEAFKSAKPVITSTDAGGVLEFAVNEESGLVEAPEPERMARVMNRLFFDRKLCRDLGEAGLTKVPQTTWAEVVEALIGGL